MRLDRLIIENFKGFRSRFVMDLNYGLNVIVGDNEAGKSTILEAINLALTGVYNGRYVRNELSQYLFNAVSIQEYLDSLEGPTPEPPPKMLIELHLKGDDLAVLEGDGNSGGVPAPGVLFRIEFDESFRGEYETLVGTGEVKTLPIEYFRIVRKAFSRADITNRSIPLKSTLIDTSAIRNQSGSDVYISRVIKELLTQDEIVSVSQAHRRMKEQFMSDPSVAAINRKVSRAANVTQKEVSISVELGTSSAWETSLTTYLDEIPFHFVGKGEQTVIKTNLALSHDKAQQANLVLMEEPENHLSHGKLNQLLKVVRSSRNSKQTIVTTHSSFVANKLGLGDLILLNDRRTLKFDDLPEETGSFFQKISGYDTLRLLLCKKAILVEGDSDELIVQRAFRDSNSGALPIEKGVEVISVGTSFLRFLEIAERLNCKVCVVTDNDGDPASVKRKYSEYLGDNANAQIRICFDETVDSGDLEIRGRDYNYNTLEPKLLKANSLASLNDCLGKNFETEDELRVFMQANKTECALHVFDYESALQYPEYVLAAIRE